MCTILATQAGMLIRYSIVVVALESQTVWRLQFLGLRVLCFSTFKDATYCWSRGSCAIWRISQVLKGEGQTVSWDWTINRIKWVQNLGGPMYSWAAICSFNQSRCGIHPQLRRLSAPGLRNSDDEVDCSLAECTQISLVTEFCPKIQPMKIWCLYANRKWFSKGLRMHLLHWRLLTSWHHSESESFLLRSLKSSICPLPGPSVESIACRTLIRYTTLINSFHFPMFWHCRACKTETL